MTKQVCFHNSGSLDHRAFTMMGLSAKADAKTAIGYFGTGFKYAIATLIRNGCSVVINVKNKKTKDSYTQYTFYVHSDEFRDTKQDFIYCTAFDPNSGSIAREFELPYTTHFGVNWKVWQAYRELYTNCVIDEKGGVLVIDEHYIDDVGMPDDVCVIVTGAEFEKVHEQHDKYFINSECETVAKTHRMRAVEKLHDSDNVVYYKSMYTGTHTEKPSLFTYDYISKVSLTEDRTLADVWYIKSHVGDIWVQSMSYETLIEYLPLASDKSFFESDLETYQPLGDDFIAACAYLIKMRRPLPLWAHQLYIKSRPFDEQVNCVKLTKYQEKMLAKAARVLEHNGCLVDVSAIKICVSLPEDLMGMVQDHTIFLSSHVFEKGDMTLLGTLYEEWLHHAHNCEDMTRKMQNLLVDRVALLMQQVYVIECE
jgi:hypothetical protein